MKTPSLSTNCIHRSLGQATLLPVLLMMACFGLSQPARAVCQQGCHANQNTALGDAALVNNTGAANTAVGSQALSNNTIGLFNTAIGASTLVNNTTGFNNTATGISVLFNNTTGSNNTASGPQALYVNTTGGGNTATGGAALFGNTTGGDNTAIGFDALFGNTTGNDNTAIGNEALSSNSTGSNNIAIGVSAGQNISQGGNNIDVGNTGVGGDANTIRIGTQGTQSATFIAGIRGTPITGGIPVGVNSSGQLGVAPSSQRFKEAIEPIDKASEAILWLKPVTFRYKKNLDPEGIPQFGLVAEEVEKVNPDLVARDAAGKAYTVRYEAVNAMLLNEFLKAHRTVQEQGATITRLEKQVKVLTAGLQKVSAQLELSKAEPRAVVSNQ